MNRMSARFVGNKVGKSASWVYSIWENTGLVLKDKFGDWALTDEGRSIGRRMSKNNYRSVAIFDFGVIEKIMIDFYVKHGK
ncbi:MAG: hypothetical protein J6A25_10400 [Lachnospiraceae bacterium]|nr:hypothetical protein [Lachnospiraceae bacterium]